MFYGYYFIGIVALFLIFYFVSAYIRNRALRNDIKKKYTTAVKERLSEMDSKMTYVSYRGFNIPMTVLEKRTMWDNMTRDARNKALADFKQALKDKRIKEYKTK